MGGALLSTPWRELPNDNRENLHFVKSYQPQNTETKHLRILLHGPVGAGKSSFINSVDTVLKGRETGRALTDATSASSFTPDFKTYKIHKDAGNTYSFVFNDIMGFEKNTNHGVHVEDIKLILKGHVKEGYKLNPAHPLKEGDQGHNSHPTLEDRVHVLVCVVPADLVTLMDDEIMNKMRDVRLAASEMGIPQLAILTKVDAACSNVKRNMKNIYKSKNLKGKVEEFHKLLGIPLNCIFLVKNYGAEMRVNHDIDAPILCALRQMVYFGEDFLNDQ